MMWFLIGGMGLAVFALLRRSDANAWLMICDSPSHEARFSYVRIFDWSVCALHKAWCDCGNCVGLLRTHCQKSFFWNAAQHLGKAVSCFRNVWLLFLLDPRSTEGSICVRLSHHVHGGTEELRSPSWYLHVFLGFLISFGGESASHPILILLVKMRCHRSSKIRTHQDYNLI